MLPAFVPLPVIADATVRALQDAIQRALKRVCQCPLLDGQLVPSTPFAAGATVVLAHRLGRAPLGYLVVGQSAPASITAPTAATAQYIPLTASAACTAALWIF